MRGGIDRRRCGRLRKIEADGNIGEWRHGEVDRIAQRGGSGRNVDVALPVKEQSTVGLQVDGSCAGELLDVCVLNLQRLRPERVGYLHASACAADTGVHDLP